MKSLIRNIYDTSLRDVYQVFANARRIKKTKAVVETYMRTQRVRKLHVGCGGNFFESWLNSDLVPNNQQVALLDAGRPFPIPNDTFHYVYCEHLIEHLNCDQQLNFLFESYRILKPGGKIRIATPDFNFLMKLADNNRSEFQTNYLNWNFNAFLNQVPRELINESNIHVYVINNYFRDWGHQLIHNKSSISTMIEYCRFRNLRFEEVGSSADPTLRHLEQHGKMITDTYNKYETMVVEAEKV